MKCFTLCDRAGGSFFRGRRGTHRGQETCHCWRRCPPRSSGRTADATSQTWSGWLRRARRRRRSAATTWATKQVRISLCSVLRTAAVEEDKHLKQNECDYKMEKTPRHHFFHDDGRICEKKEEKKKKQNSKRKRMGYNRSMMLLVDNNRVWLPTKNKQLSPSHGPNVAQLFGLAFFFSCDFFLLVNLKRTQTHFE